MRQEQIKKEMTVRGIPFREDERGFVLYDKKYKAEVGAIERDIDGALAFKYEDPAQNEIALAVLKDMGIKVRTEERTDGPWIVWTPKSADEQRSAQERVQTAIYEAHRKKVDQDCKQRLASQGKQGSKC